MKTYRGSRSGCGARPASYPMGTGALSMGVKRPRREADHSPLSSAEVKNLWNYTSTPPIRLHGVVVCLILNKMINIFIGKCGPPWNFKIIRLAHAHLQSDIPGLDEKRLHHRPVWRDVIILKSKPVISKYKQLTAKRKCTEWRGLYNALSTFDYTIKIECGPYHCFIQLTNSMEQSPYL
jgi:hypothetical protein